MGIVRFPVLLFILITLAAWGCSSGTTAPDAGDDAGEDAGVDAGQDAGTDAGQDAGADTGSDPGQDAGADQDDGGDPGADGGRECEESADCPADRPVCDSDHTCRGCQNRLECLAREGVTEGFVCNLITGHCTEGDCYPDGEPCDPSIHGICEQFICRPCENLPGAQEDDCQANAYPDGVLCVEGECLTAECNQVATCEFDRVCLDYACVDCIEGDEDYCTDNGMNCDTATHNCVGCTSDDQCAGGQRICEDNTCRDCLMGECGAGRVCANGSCQTGDCWIDGQLWQDGETLPGNPCSVCDRAVTQYAWSANPNVPCSDDIDCTHSDLCSVTIAGACVGQTYECPSLPCAAGVCHGTGSDDCTLERDPEWTGCFIDATCYAVGNTRPGNDCQYCDGSVDDWTGKPAGTTCGNCLTCQDTGGQMDCFNVADGQDTNEDCLEICQVCNGDGSCRYVAAGGTDPNPNYCLPSEPTECGQNGLCAGGGPYCDHWSDVPGVSDGNECTVNDRCDGIGGITGDPVADGTLCDTNRLCFDGECRNCQAGECPTTPDLMVCDSGHCVIGNCTSPDDCGPPPECKVWACTDNLCTEQNSSQGNCDDENPCTLNDYCLSGICQPGTGVPDCTHEDDWCNAGACAVINPDTYDCVKAPLPSGTPCAEDVFDCTVEECDGGDGGNPGQCLVASITGGQCFIDDVCYDNNDLSENGCGICQAATSQTEWQTMPGGTPCGIDPCDQLCSGLNCISRWWYRPQQCALAIPPYPILRCILDRVSGRYYFYRGTCNSGCYCRATYADAEAACENLGLRLPTRAEYEAFSVPGCTTQDCSEPPEDIQADPVFGGRIQWGYAYWTSEYPWVIAYLSAQVLIVPSAHPDYLNNFMCIEN